VPTPEDSTETDILATVFENGDLKQEYTWDEVKANADIGDYDRGAVMAKAKKLADEEYKTDRKAAMYVKIMQKIKEKGDEYIDTESKRVAKILEGKVTPEKSAEMGDKMKVLGMFKTDEL